MSVKTTTVPFGAWEPDAPIYAGSHARTARNVIPAKTGYRSFPSLADLGKNALTARVLDVVSMKDLSGGLLTFATTASGIYQLVNAAWVSRCETAASTNNRAFAAYGSNLYALYGGTLLKLDFSAMTSGFTAVSNAPSGKVLAVVRDFLVMGCLDSGQGNAVRWSGLDNPDSWPTVGSTAAIDIQSDIQIFPVGGNVMSIVGGVGGCDGLIFQEEAVRRMTYVGPQLIFQFDEVDRRRGTIAGKSPLVCENVCVYLASDGWYLTDGESVKAIGAERIDQWFFDNVEMSRISEVRGVWDSSRRVALWTFPSTVCPADRHDRVLVYNYLENRWAYAEMDCEILFPDYARGITLEDLDEYGELEGLPFANLDLNSMKNGVLGLNGFSTAHKICRMNGASLEAELETAEQGSGRMMIHGIRPLIDRGDALAMPIYRSRQSDALEYADYAPQARDGVCYCHVSANYARARVKVPAGSAWENAVGCEVLTEQEGGM